ncbi:MAG: hypothetical protein Kow0047_22770 [Anaerolineae bacterium]
MGRTDQGVEASRHRYHAIPRTLCFITHGGEVLLLRGAPTKRIWPNRYNGVGGHIERGEDPYSSARREIREETGLEVRDLRLRAVVHVDTDDPAAGILLFVFTARALDRQVRPSPEGTLEWVRREELADLDLVEDLPYLLPKVLAMGDADPPLFGTYRYDADDRLIIRWTTPC